MCTYKHRRHLPIRVGLEVKEEEANVDFECRQRKKKKNYENIESEIFTLLQILLKHITAVHQAVPFCVLTSPSSHPGNCSIN